MFNFYSKFDYPTALRRWLVLVLICCAVTSIHAQETNETKSVGENTLTGTQQTTSGKLTIRPIRTDSPRNTLKSFLRLRDELEQSLRFYRLNKSRELAEHVQAISSQFRALLNLSSVPPSSRRKIGTDTTAYLLDILGRVELPNLKSVPDEEAFDDDVSPAKWRIPGTPIRIVRADEGPREGEFLFSERTVMVAPRFYKGIEDLPLQTSLPIISWHRAVPQLTGPMIPAAVLRIVPQSLRDFWLDTPKWKVIVVVLVSALAALLLFVFLITVPNAALADMQLINWAKCDRMLINATIGLRYETEDDQLRYVLVKFREMLHAHPKIHSDTVRVRFAGFGQSSLDIGVRIYALTRDFNEYHAIREDVLLRMSEIVKASGSSFAFPSQTLYMGRDDGLDSERGETAAKEVESWRKAGKLPFPRFAADRIEQLEGTLDYPPRGSVEAGTFESQVWETSEGLSTEPEGEEVSERKPPSQKRGDDS